MDILFSKICGAYGFSPNIFYDLLFKEAELILKGRREQEEHEFYLMQIACTNAVGSCFGGKKFKPIEPFKKENSTTTKSDKKRSREELLAELESVKKSFNK